MVEKYLAVSATVAAVEVDRLQWPDLKWSKSLKGFSPLCSAKEEKGKASTIVQFTLIFPKGENDNCAMIAVSFTLTTLRSCGVAE